jgi:hypothetical protein
MHPAFVKNVKLGIYFIFRPFFSPAGLLSFFPAAKRL